MVNDVSRRIDAFEAGGHHPYRSSLVPPEVEHAARIGNVGPVQQYLQAGKDPNARSVYQSQLLHVAARHGQTDVLKVLVKAAGIDIMALDYGGMRRTALHWSCQTGDIRSVEVLVDAGANTTVQGKSWAKMVQGRRCGSLLQSNAPPEESPADLCKTNLVRLALLRPPWSPESHKDFPEEFRAVARLLVLAAGGRSQAAEQAQVADEQPAVAPAPSQQWPLSLDLTRTIIAQAAYPFSAWLPDERDDGAASTVGIGTGRRTVPIVDSAPDSSCSLLDPMMQPWADTVGARRVTNPRGWVASGNGTALSGPVVKS